MSSTTKVTVALNAMGQVAAASVHSANQSDVTSGMVADLGQTLLELEVAFNVTEMGADKFLAHLAEHASIKAATARFAASRTSGQEVTSGTI